MPDNGFVTVICNNVPAMARKKTASDFQTYYEEQYLHSIYSLNNYNNAQHI